MAHLQIVIREEETRFGSPAVLGSFVAGYVAEDARTRGFPSPSFGGFGFVNLVEAYALFSGYTTKILVLKVCFRPEAVISPYGRSLAGH